MYSTDNEVWPWSSRNDFIASLISVYSELTEEGSTSKYPLTAAMHLAQRCCYCWKHFWSSCSGTAFSAVVCL
jgi:hypothetical protein